MTALKHLNPYIICLRETHLKNDQMINIDNYVPYDHKRQHIHVNAPQGSGVVYFLVKNSVYNDYTITELDKCHEGILALSFTNKISGYPLLSLIHIYPQKTHPGEDMQQVL